MSMFCVRKVESFVREGWQVTANDVFVVLGVAMPALASSEWRIYVFYVR